MASNLYIERVYERSEFGHKEADIALDLRERGSPTLSGMIEVSIRYLTADELSDYTCSNEIRSHLTEGFDRVIVVKVLEAWVSNDYKGQGVGKRLYLEALKEASKELGEEPFIYIPSCCHKGHTSLEAKRVWASLKRRYAYEGDVLYINSQSRHDFQ